MGEFTKNHVFDLHIHSTASDGTYSPAEIINLAIQSKVVALALTDHDSISGYFEAKQIVRYTDLTVIAGVELNTDAYGREIDILGYFWDPDNQEFLDMLQERQANRIVRAKKIVDKLNEIGINITYARVRELAHGAVCRPHIIEAMIEKDYVTDQKEAFEKFLGLGKPAFVPHDKLTPEIAIKLISEAKGLPVIAHPGLIGDDGIVVKLLQEGVKGLEAYYPLHNPDQINKYIDLANEYQAIVTCGTDSHGPKRKKSFSIGSMYAPPEVLSIFQKRLREIYLAS